MTFDEFNNHVSLLKRELTGTDLDILFDELEDILLCHTYDKIIKTMPLIYRFGKYAIKIELQ